MAKQSKFPKNDLFQKAIDYLFREKKVKGKGNLAKCIGISPSTLSHILAHEQEVSDETIYKLNEAFGNIFNMEYFRGRSEDYLIEDIEAKHVSESGHPTMSSVFNANLAQQAESVEAFRIALASKDETIQEKDKRILELKEALAGKEAHIENLKELVAQLRADLNEAKAIIAATESGIIKYPFNIGVADNGDRPRKNV